MRRVQGFGAGASVDKEVLLAQTSLLNKKSTRLGGFFVCKDATKKIFLSFLNKVSNSHGA